MVHSPDSVPLQTLVSTRMQLHAIAEHVLAAARYRAEGRIALYVLDGGFGTQPFGEPPEQLAVLGSSLMVRTFPGTVSYPLTTLRELAGACGVEPGGPADVYELATPLRPDEPLHVDDSAARQIEEWLGLGDAALRSFTDTLNLEDSEPIVLWPEHFDVATTIGECNYGCSPGDEISPEPYVNVGPHDEARRIGSDFWNAPFGAYRTWREISDVSAAVAFFQQGLNLFEAGQAGAR